VIEEGIMRCRDVAADWQKGLLRDYGHDTAPVKLEASVRASIEAAETERLAQGDPMAAFV
jgi:hypothetical protein